MPTSPSPPIRTHLPQPHAPNVIDISCIQNKYHYRPRQWCSGLERFTTISERLDVQIQAATDLSRKKKVVTAHF